MSAAGGETTSAHAWASEPLAGLSLIILAGGMPRVVMLPEEGEVILGRGDRCTVIVDDASVSREHASLCITQAQHITLRDLGSRNGTRLAGKEVATDMVVDVAFNQVI